MQQRRDGGWELSAWWHREQQLALKVERDESKLLVTDLKKLPARSERLLALHDN